MPCFWRICHYVWGWVHFFAYGRYVEQELLKAWWNVEHELMKQSLSTASYLWPPRSTSVVVVVLVKPLF